MMRIFPLPCLLVLATLGLSQAQADDCADPQGGCPTNDYLANHFAGTPKSCPAPPPAFVEKICHDNGTPPAPPELRCEPLDGNHYLCEASPEGEGLTYSWTANNMQFSEPPAPEQFTVLVSCDYGSQRSVSVQVFSPQGNGTAVVRRYTPCAPF